ncbi:hypothetical protein PMAC_001775 [Pneumocystis sp. 'macacae']|nr:hypothetical protein PMAC_001775 [Pneumocystis sp. 'macacae']
MRRRLLYHSFMHSGSARPLHGVHRLPGLTRLNALYALLAPTFRWADVFKRLIPASRPKFHVKMTIHHLNNVPLVSGQELNGAGHQLLLGKVGINLAEYAGLSRGTECYLLQNSKVNSLLRISISMEQIGGNTNYIINPPQKKQMFYGIADLMSKHNNTNQEKSHLNDISLKKMRNPEFFIYEDNMIANMPYLFDTFHSLEIIENIFNGKDKWLRDSYVITNQRQHNNNHISKKNSIAKDILDDNKREIKTAQDWEIKELEYGVCWSLNKSLDKSY